MSEENHLSVSTPQNCLPENPGKLLKNEAFSRIRYYVCISTLAYESFCRIPSFIFQGCVYRTAPVYVTAKTVANELREFGVRVYTRQYFSRSIRAR